MTVPFLEKLIQLLAQGGFTSTYKYAVLLGLVDLCIEAGQPPTSVTTTQLARRVVELYWPQAREFEPNSVLRQNAGGQAEILRLIAAYTRPQPDRVSASWAAHLDPGGFSALLLEVEWVLIEYPLPRVQRVGAHLDPFIYQIGWDTAVKRSDFLQRGRRRPEFDNTIRFLDGASAQLVQLAPLLAPMLRSEWTQKVSQLNDLRLQQVQQFLFGTERSDHADLQRPLRLLQNGLCFYCRQGLTGQSQIDHFLPWSRYADDGLDNLVLVHQSCNREKLHFLADLEFAKGWAERSLRESDRLDEISSEARWARDRRRTFGVVATVYQGVPDGVRLWGEKGLRLVAVSDLAAVHGFGKALLAS